MEHIPKSSFHHYSSHSTDSGSAWIWFAFSAVACFTVCNTSIADITQQAGPECLFYFASGGVTSGATYNLLKAYSNYKLGGKFWNN